MINKKEEEINVKTTAEERTPDDAAGLLIGGFFKIVDPETQEVLVSGRS